MSVDIRNAYHEAGHAVLNVSCGCGLKCVTLDCVTPDGPLSDRDKIMSLFASQVGEELCPVEGDPQYLGDQLGKDMRDCLIREYARLYRDPETEQELRDREDWAREYAGELLDAVRSLLTRDPYKQAVDVFAVQLAERKQIEGPEAETIIRAVLGGQAPQPPIRRP